jgi:16S rRNA (uracil1498-N3)-methyltransferase
MMMQRHRFYAPPSLFTLESVLLDEDESHHLARVLRLGEGARAFVFDGEGEEWECEVARADSRESLLNLIGKLEDRVESPLRLTLAQALVKGDKFDLVVRKATELGVSRIVPLITEHCEVRRAEERAEQRLQRWRRISLEALKQCGRRKLVEIAEPAGFIDFCANEAGRKNLIFSERARHSGRSLREVSAGLQEIDRIGVCVAAEGGWSEKELEAADASGFIPVHLGGRILRTETAAIVAVALMQYLIGDLG